MTERNRDQNGAYKTTHSDAEVIDAVWKHDPASTSEVAVELNLSRQGADHRLRSLEESEQVESKKIGASLVWFLPRHELTEQRISERRQ
jgi:predicted ArsR family transcriptional regulator